MVLRSAVLIVKESLQTLLEGVPPGVDVEQLVRFVSSQLPQVRLHHIHVWELGPGQLALTAHMRLNAMSVVEAESIASQVRQILEREWGITHATLEAEVNGCGREQILGDWH